MFRNLKFSTIVLGVYVAMWLALVGAMACSDLPFVGPANAPVACPVRCENDMCCPFDTECAKGGKCRFLGTPDMP